MLKREQIEAILKVNGIDSSSPDEEIRSILLSARFDKGEVDAALMVLKENTKTNITRVDGLHKVFRSDIGLSPEEVSSLLGIDMEIEDFTERRLKEENRVAWLQAVITVVIAIILSFSGVIGAMYVYKVGIFHPDLSFF